MWVRPIAVFWMEDEKGGDAKVLCVPSRDERYNTYQDLANVPQHLLAEISNFFEVYKLLEPHKETNVKNWEGRDAAEKEIAASMMRFEETHTSH
jgi:inorganic pyrophosphatase